MSIENKIEKNIDLTKEELIEAKKILNEEGPVEGPSKNSLGAVVVGSEGEEISDLTKKYLINLTN